MRRRSRSAGGSHFGWKLLWGAREQTPPSKGGCAGRRARRPAAHGPFPPSRRRDGHSPPLCPAFMYFYESAAHPSAAGPVVPTGPAPFTPHRPAGAPRAVAVGVRAPRAFARGGLQKSGRGAAGTPCYQQARAGPFPVRPPPPPSTRSLCCASDHALTPSRVLRANQHRPRACAARRVALQAPGASGARRSLLSPRIAQKHGCTV
ncbi:MAG: hypothetical protein J3K34DRAFT_422517 [Monoraphidium minutum]|nr:MAG: hypothetical protein J3K34DRAFT_422517 [Monoraphidium minutum]